MKTLNETIKSVNEASGKTGSKKALEESYELLDELCNKILLETQRPKGLRKYNDYPKPYLKKVLQDVRLRLDENDNVTLEDPKGFPKIQQEIQIRLNQSNILTKISKYKYSTYKWIHEKNYLISLNPNTGLWTIELY